MNKVSTFLVLSFLAFSVQAADKDSWQKLREYQEKKDINSAVLHLQKEVTSVSPQELPKQEQANYYLRVAALAELLYRQENWQSAYEKFSEIRRKIPEMRGWIELHLGAIARQREEWKKARGHLFMVNAKNASVRTRRWARYELALVEAGRGHWRSARRHLYFLERRWRSEPRYVDVLWRLIRAERKTGRRWKSCRWARKLYAKFPAHPQVLHWGIDLLNADYEGQRLDCLPTLSDQKSRLRRLQWSGESDRAARELAQLKEKSGESTYHLASIEAKFLSGEGHAIEALKLLLPFYETQRRNYSYLMSLGKTAAQASEENTAIGAYYQAYKHHRRSRRGRKALFQAAFLSYQIQDYDGATAKFEEFLKRYRRSGLRRDARWHLAWMKYLKKDYAGAERALARILREKRRRRWYWRKYSTEKLQYWRAVSLLKMQRVREANEVFTRLADKKLKPYYSILAQQRLTDIKNKKIENLEALVNQRSEKGTKSLDEGSDNEDIIADDLKSSEADESEETIASLEDEETDEEEDGSEESSEDSEEGIAETDFDIEFKNPRFAGYFERARNFIKIGLNEEARWALYEIERSTRHRPYLQSLLPVYDQIQSFNRSSYVSEIFFSRERKKEIEQKTQKTMWRYAYPNAYPGLVDGNSREFGVPKEFVWSIIRAESQFKKNARSVVGAQGLMQLMPATAKQVSRLLDEEFRRMDLGEPKVNIRLGTRYLNRLLKKFEGRIPLAAAGYNAGPHRVDRWLTQFGTLEFDEFVEHIPFYETRHYVKKVVRNFEIYRTLYARAPSSVPWMTQPVGVISNTRQFYRENWD